MQIGFIGLGNLGTPIAENLLQAQQSLFIYNRTAAKAQALAEKGAVITPYKIRESRRALATRKQFDVVIAYDPPSLYLACRLFQSERHKIIDYSLEVSDELHRDFVKTYHRAYFRIRREFGRLARFQQHFFLVAQAVFPQLE